MKMFNAGLLSLAIAANSFAQVIENDLPNTPPPQVLNAQNSFDISITSTSSVGSNDLRLIVGGSGDYSHSLIRVNNPVFNTDATTIKLKLFCFGANGGVNVGMYLDLVTSPWDNTTGWNNAPSFIIQRALPAPSVSLTVPYEIDITDIWEQWKSGVPNYGIQLRPIGIANQFNEFHSADAANTAYRPKYELSVKYVLRFPMPSLPSPAPISSDFGVPVPGTFCGTQQLVHTGVDLPAPVGTEVVAAQRGVVKLVTNDPVNGARIVIEHTLPNFVFTTSYGNVRAIKKEKDKDKPAKERDLQVGDIVQIGEPIGRLVRGSELHESYLHLQIREAPFAHPITILDQLPAQQPCGGAPVFPELFYDPKKASWSWGF